MPNNKYSYSIYDKIGITPLNNDYLSERRRVASLIRDVQERLQTTALPIDELINLGNDLEAQLQNLSNDPKLFGRKAWMEAKCYGDYEILHSEFTPVIGLSNPLSTGLKIWYDKDKAFGSVTFSWMYEGADNFVHGGIIAALFDEFLGAAQLLTGKTGMTGSLATKFHKPTPLNQELHLEAEVMEINGRKIIITGEMWADDIMTASSKGLFITPKE